MIVESKTYGLALSLLLLTAQSALAAPSAEFVRGLNAYLSGSSVNLITDGFKYKGHKITGNSVAFIYQDRTAGSAGKKARAQAADKILKVVCTHQIKSGAVRNDMQFVAVMTNWNGTPIAKQTIHISDCP